MQSPHEERDHEQNIPAAGPLPCSRAWVSDARSRPWAPGSMVPDAPRLILRSTRRISFPDGHDAVAFAYHVALSPEGTRIAYFDGMFDHSHSLWVVKPTAPSDASCSTMSSPTRAT